jgi:protein-S-isoprenylcysteine O-methyltransferase Ste14
MRPGLWLVLFGAFAAQGLCILGGAGTLDWPAAWAYLFVLSGSMVGLTVSLAQRDPALLAERMRGTAQKGQPLWDKIYASSLQLIWFGWLTLMGLDHRFGWSAMPGWLTWVGVASVALGFWIIHLTFLENSFLSPAVRVQSERGHEVVSTGPYAIVRHPMYAGAMFLFAGTALALGSWWGLLGGTLLELSVASRILGEERVLRAGLAGYADYADRVHYRLIPFVW